MRVWLVLLGGMIVWTIHFFSIYAFGSIWLTSPTARVLTGLVTALCLAADAAIFVLCARLTPSTAPGLPLYWPARAGLIGAGLSFIAVLWQGLPALIG